MIYRLCILAFASLVFSFNGCITHPPTATPSAETGQVFVTSTPTSASIIVDGVRTGRTTPDTLTAEVGQRLIQLEKDGYAIFSQSVSVVTGQVRTVSAVLQASFPKVVLIEDFSNVSCVPCVVSNKIIETLTNRTYGRSRVVAIKFPTNFPSPNDTFYIHNRADCNSRISFYSVLFAPTTMVDGISRPNASDSLQMKDTINARLQIDPRFKLTVRDSIGGGQYFATVVVQILNASGLDLADLRLHTVVTETDIHFPTPPGSNGETVFYDVMRRMLPSNAGEQLATSATTTYQRQVALHPRWNAANLNIVCYIQNIITKEVYQTDSTF
ncbi:MAG: PEGA domain-containing protein [Ignavibacteriae bacterium]|nr:PEGA domain-containing protein [Ignavibacteriota bacterium]